MSECLPLYYWANQQNFGDELSKYLVEKITKKKVRFAPTTELGKLVAIGSILNTQTCYSESFIWGSGVLHFNAFVEEKRKLFPLNKFLASLRKRKFGRSSIFAVRGPLTKEILEREGFNVPDVFGDPAILLPKFYTPSELQGDDIGVILHLTHENSVDKEKLVSMGCRFISILREGTKGIESFIDEVCLCKRIYSTSLHGVIVAQAYGIPAQWIQIENKAIHADQDLKFRDYFMGAGQIIQTPLKLKTIYDLDINVQPPEIRPFPNAENLLQSFPSRFL